MLCDTLRTLCVDAARGTGTISPAAREAAPTFFRPAHAPAVVLVTCEGIDGSGKSTAARAVADALREAGHDVRATREPTRTWLGEAVRRAFAEDASPWTEALLFMADHAAHVARVRADLAAGAVVVSDRWSDSTFAYQGAALAREGFDAVARLRDMERDFDLRPDLTLLFDVDVGTALSRVAARGGAVDKFERAAFLGRVRENYLRLAREDAGRFAVLDASQPPDAVAKAAAEAALARTSRRQP